MNGFRVQAAAPGDTANAPVDTASVSMCTADVPGDEASVPVVEETAEEAKGNFRLVSGNRDWFSG
jgi:hypothetical protein